MTDYDPDYLIKRFTEVMEKNGQTVNARENMVGHMVRLQEQVESLAKTVNFQHERLRDMDLANQVDRADSTGRRRMAAELFYRLVQQKTTPTDARYIAARAFALCATFDCVVGEIDEAEATAKAKTKEQR